MELQTLTIDNELFVVQDLSEDISPARLVLDRASQADLTIVTVECCTGSGISSALSGLERSGRYEGGYIFNCARAVQRMFGLECQPGPGLPASGAELALTAARNALRQANAGIALAVAAPPAIRRGEPVHFAVVDGCDHHWSHRLPADTAKAEIAEAGLTFLAHCIPLSAARHF